jgi:hypothetical protein
MVFVPGQQTAILAVKLCNFVEMGAFSPFRQKPENQKWIS